MFRMFAADSIPLSAETVFNLGPLPITNSMFYGVITAIVVVVVLLSAAKLSTYWPKSRFAFVFESLIEFIFGIAKDTFGDEGKARKHLPFLLALFIFILFSNLSGLLPGVGTVTYDNIPLLRAFTTDLNGTLALAILTIVSVQVYAIKELGLAGHFYHYFTKKPLKPINLFVGLNEIFSELLRIVTLSMRLFGVIYAGEVLIHAIGVLAGNFAWAATVPVVLIEIFFSLIQAYLFMMLTMVYLAIATSKEKEAEDQPRPILESNIQATI